MHHAPNALRMDLNVLLLLLVFSVTVMASYI